MKIAFLAFLVFALAGCQSPPGTDTQRPASAASDTPRPSLNVTEVHVHLASDLQVCAPNGLCQEVGNSGHSPHIRFVKGNYTAFDLNISFDDSGAAPTELKGQVRFVARCVVGAPDRPPWNPCPEREGELASAQGPMPLKFAAQNLGIGYDQQLMLEVQYSGAGEPFVNGSGGSFLVDGLIVETKG